MLKKEHEIVVEERREMTVAEVESVAALLFQWWRRAYESSTLVACENRPTGEDEVD